MLETAIRLMQSGATPSVSEVAEAAGVSRATAYRYFPSQAALVGAVVDEGLGPILTWRSASQDPARRVAELIDTGLPRIDAFEATFKAALKLSLDQWARRQAGTLGEEPQFKRGHRIDLLARCPRAAEGKTAAEEVRPPGAGAFARLRRRGADRSQGYLGAGWSRNAICGSMGGKRAGPCRFGRGCRRDAKAVKPA